MNVYDLMYSLNWYRATSLDLPSSVLAIILSDPMLFVRSYVVAFLKFSPFWILPFLAFVTAKEQILRRLCAVIFLWSLAYFALFSATTSGRQGLLAMPLVFFSIAVLLRSTWLYATMNPTAKTRLVKVAIPLLSLVTLAIFCQRDIHKIVLRSNEHAACGTVETLLRSHGCTSVNQVFATDYDIYFKTMPPYTLLSNGGAPRWGTYGVQEELPEFPVDTLDVFARACRERGVKFAVLTSEAEKYSEALGGLYGSDKAEDFKLIGKIGRFSVFEVTEK
jgi:hypothetical protein